MSEVDLDAAGLGGVKVDSVTSGKPKTAPLPGVDWVKPQPGGQ